MKQLSKLLVFVLFFGFLAGCNGNLEKVLPEKGGKWNLDHVKWSIYNNDVLRDEGEGSGEGFFEFKSDGEGAYFEEGNEIPLEWSFDKKNDKITLVYATGLTHTYEVIKSTAETQKWHGTVIESKEVSPGVFAELREEIEYDLSRRE